ncbi:MAG: thiamine pyrophosphate-dependent dehydrogenase E1 component subunit alpha, partial [Nitrospinaceae bacterium]|nr:thiamine pyrophosphate-dependent dehydrogenase E1 component subunit alpha [Nitrospinaceae bacterium]
LKSGPVDGTEVLEVYEAARAAVERARAGQGPSFIESLAYRWRGHGGAGDDSKTGYRDPAEVEQWQAHCPIQKLEDRLRLLKGLGPADKEKMEKEIREEIREAFDHAIRSPHPGEDDLSTFVYSD